MDIGKWKRFIYASLVDSHPLVSRSYACCQDADALSHGLCAKMLLILKLNWKHRICKKGLDESLCSLPMPEDRAHKLPPAAQLAQQLGRYDVVSFDIFDTLIFRAVEHPTDVFRLLEGKWGHLGFASQREAAERRARLKKQEASIGDIYDILSRELSIDKEEGIACELMMEQQVCYANPYMQEVFRRLLAMGKTIAAVSDMYIPHDDMVRLLEGCGYAGLDRVFVSCDYGAGKGTGALQAAVQQEMGRHRSYIHVGDSMHSDIRGSRKAGWDVFYYPNVQKLGSPYRRMEMVSLASSFYKGLVNARLHCGVPCGSGCYQYGYAYGGIMAMGYCQYLERLAQKEGIDQFLFVARDGFVLNKIYGSFFHQADAAYVPFSRAAAYQITMERSWRSFLQNAVSPRIRENAKEMLGEVARICGIEYLEPFFGQYGLDAKMVFCESTYRRVEQIFEEHLGEILPYYAQGERAAAQYLKGVIQEHKNVCVVDIGWTGTGAACLHYFLKEKCGMDIKVSGALMGMGGSVPARTALDTKLIHSYMFSAGKNHENLARHTGKQNDIDFRNLLIEILFTEDKPTFLGFRYDDNGQVELDYGALEHNGDMIQDIQNGIYDFCRDFYPYSVKFPRWLEINGQEAYLPLNGLAEAKEYCMELLGEYEIDKNPGNDQAGIKKFKEIINI